VEEALDVVQLFQLLDGCHGVEKVLCSFDYLFLVVA
jgi:hypothetical protein